MHTINRMTLVAGVARDPVVNVKANGRKAASLVVVTNEALGAKPEYHRVSTHVHGVASFVESHVRKGAVVYVEGPLVYDEYKPADGGGIAQPRAQVAAQRLILLRKAR